MKMNTHGNGKKSELPLAFLAGNLRLPFQVTHLVNWF